jgi:hypothetical protein
MKTQCFSHRCQYKSNTSYVYHCKILSKLRFWFCRSMVRFCIWTMLPNDATTLKSKEVGVYSELCFFVDRLNWIIL